MQSYRITFQFDINVDYWNDFKLQSESSFKFKELPDLYFPIISRIKVMAYDLGITYFWHFYEPYVEITWLSDRETTDKLFEQTEEYLKFYNIQNVQRCYPKPNENFGDWFCKNEKEKEFGCKVHALCSDYVDLYNQYKDSIDNGKTLEEQTKRTIHRLCNPLGLNYMDEAYICFSRGLICLLFRFFKFRTAVWIYTNIFRQKY